MSLWGLDKDKLKLILRTSESFPTQYQASQAKVTADGRVSPSRAGHSLSQHVRGVQLTTRKTKFCSLDDMADALDMVLKTADGRLSLQKLERGSKREQLRVRIGKLFDI